MTLQTFLTKHSSLYNYFFGDDGPEPTPRRRPAARPAPAPKPAPEPEPEPAPEPEAPKKQKWVKSSARRRKTNRVNKTHRVKARSKR